MSLRLEMLQVARLARQALGDSSELVREFLLCQQNDDGGFKDRDGNSDLYYTVFGIESLLALEPTATPKLSAAPATSFLTSVRDRVAVHLRSFGTGADLDFVHLCCLARCWSALGYERDAEERRQLLKRIEEFRSRNGGYHARIGSESGTAYGAFLALGAHQDLQRELEPPSESPHPGPLLLPKAEREIGATPGLVQSLKFLETPDGAWTNDRPAGCPTQTGSTNATAAAVMVLRQLGMPVSAAVPQWLLARCHPEGGILASPNAPMPDLLSTATALHALDGLQAPLDGLRERCLDFIDTLWTNEGSFHGNWADENLDCEYTFYGLLALGHLV